MLRDELRALKGTLSLPIVYVTHDVNEALFLADDILPVVEGKIDRKWMQQTITRVASPETGRSRAVREPRLSLAY
jgi:molybdate transport system ATP-binding protein